MSTEPVVSYRAVFEAVLARSIDPVVLCSAEGRYVVFSDSFCELTGYTREELVGRTSLELGLVDASGPRRMAEADVHAGKGGLYRNLLHRADGATRHVEFSHQLLEDGFQIVIVHDITARVLAEYMIGEPAATDPLTGLPGRRAFEDRASRLVSDAMSPVHLLLFQLTGAGGDASMERELRLLGHTLKEALAAVAHPTALGRLDDNVFAVLLAGGSSPEASQVASAVIERITGTPGHPDDSAPAWARFALATQTCAVEGMVSLMAQAEEALHGPAPWRVLSPRARPSSAPASGPSPRG